AEAEDVVGALIEGGASLWGMATHVHRSPTAARACLEAKIERLDDTLRTAASTGHAEVVRILLEGGVDAGARSKRRGETALVSACRKGHVEIARMLLDSGVDPEVKGCVDISKPGRTERVELCALEAAACASAEVVALLLERGVNRDAIGSAIAWAGR